MVNPVSNFLFPDSNVVKEGNKANAASDELQRIFGKDWDKMDQVEQANARALLDKRGDKFTDDDVKYHATNPSGRLLQKLTGEPDDSPLPEEKTQTDGEPDMDPIADKLFSPVIVKGKKK